ncbi:MAG: DUF368 domain-containing protein [Candidatus Omnitrophota bacterium]
MTNGIKETVILFLKGCAIGVANIIPGVSGGTLAVVLGVYDRLIESIACFFESPGKRKEYAIFLAKILSGAGISMLFLANVMDFLLTHHFHLTIFAFMGLILGGVPSIWRSHGDMRVKTSRVFVFIAGILIVLGPSLLGFTAIETATFDAPEMLMFDKGRYLTLLFSGFLAGGAMIVPGISGSFVLVLLGQYALIIAAIKGLILTPLIVVGFGAMAGILVFSKIIKVCLERSPAMTYYFILGLVTASFIEIFPGVPRGEHVVLFAVIIFFLGAGASYALSKISGEPA